MTPRHRVAGVVLATLLFGTAAVAQAGIRVQDIARLQGQRTNKLMGFGLVNGLNGTGDGEKYASTMRALAALHQRFHAPVLGPGDLKGNQSVAIVTVEAVIPEHGAREGEPVDVVVSVLGAAQSLQGGQLLTTPLQYAMFDPQDPATQQIFALAGGRIELLDPEVPTRGVIRGGATIEADFYYSFIEGQSITLVLNDAHASWTWAYVLANSINHAEGEIAMAQRYDRSEPRRVRQVAVAQALGPKNVRVRIPDPELINPAYFISRVLQVELFAPPEPRARVTINRLTKNVSFTGNVTVSPTVLQIPGFGAVSIGQPPDDPLQPAAPAEADESIQFEELFDTLSALKVPPELMIDAIEHLHRTGTLHAELRYVE